jgi:putative flippase GtrA
MWKILRPFIKAQFSAGAGYVCDYAFMLLLNELWGVYYLIAIAAGGLLGAAVNFLLNKVWAFRTKDAYYKFKTSQQLWRFVVVVVGGITLKVVGTNILTILTHIDYKLTRLAMDALVAVCFNYLLQKKWVFRHEAELM